MPTAEREGLREALAGTILKELARGKDTSVHWIADELIAGPLAETLAQADTAARAVAERDQLQLDKARGHRFRDRLVARAEAAEAEVVRLSRKRALETLTARRSLTDKQAEAFLDILTEADKLVAAQAEVARLSAEVETRDKALKPFAEYARLKEEAGLDWGEGEIGEFIYDGLRRSIRTQDLRAARTALAAGQDKEGGKP